MKIFFEAGQGSIAAAHADSRGFRRGARLCLSEPEAAAMDEALDTLDAEDIATAQLPLMFHVIGTGFAHAHTGDDETDHKERVECYYLALDMFHSSGDHADDGKHGSMFAIEYSRVTIKPSEAPVVDGPGPTPAPAVPISVTSAPAGPTVLTTILKPIDIVMPEPFNPTLHPVQTFSRSFMEQIRINHWAEQTVSEQIEQFIANCHPTFTDSIVIDGVRSMASLDAVFQHIKDTSKCITTTEAVRHEISLRMCSNNEDAAAWTASVLADSVKAENHSTLPEYDASFGSETERSREYRRLAGILLRGVAPQASSAFALEQDTLIEGCTTLAKLQDVRRMINREYTTRAAGASRKPGAAKSLLVDRKGSDKLRKRIAELEAAAAARTGGAANPPATSTHGADEFRPFDAAMGACKWCKSAPVSINGEAPGMHWQKLCPSAKVGAYRDRKRGPRAPTAAPGSDGHSSE